MTLIKKVIIIFLRQVCFKIHFRNSKNTKTFRYLHFTLRSAREKLKTQKFFLKTLLETILGPL